MALVTVGLTALTRLIAENEPYIAVGTGEDAESDTDTQLQTEFARKLATAVIHDGLHYEIRGFFTNLELPDEVKEWGVFLFADENTDSGLMLSRTRLDFVKGAHDLLIIFDGSIVPQ